MTEQDNQGKEEENVDTIKNTSRLRALLRENNEVTLLHAPSPYKTIGEDTLEKKWALITSGLFYKYLHIPLTIHLKSPIFVISLGLMSVRGIDRLISALVVKRRFRPVSKILGDDYREHPEEHYIIIPFSEKESPQQPIDAAIVYLPTWHGDNTMSGDTSQQDFEKDLLKKVVEDVLMRIEGTTIQTIYFAYQGDTPSSLNEHADRSRSLNNALARYHIKQHKDQQNVIPFSIDELRDLVLDVNEVLFKTANAINDHVINDLLQAYKILTGTQREQTKIAIAQRIQSLLSTEAQAIFHSYDVSTPSHETHNPNMRYSGRRAMSTLRDIRRLEKGFWLIETTTETGEIKQISLADALHITDQPIDELLRNRTIYTRAQLLLILDRLISETPQEELFKPQPSRDDLIERLKTLHLHPSFSDVSHFKTTDRSRLMRKNVVRNIKHTTYAILLGQLIKFAALQALALSPQVINVDPSNYDSNQTEIDMISGPPPEMRPVWKVSGASELVATYWITGTSYEMSGGTTWKVDERIDNTQPIVTLPLQSFQSHDIVLEKQIVVEQGTEITPPLPQDTDVIAGRFILQDGTLQSVSMTSRMDGTRVILFPNTTAGAQEGTLQVILTPASRDTKATHPMQDIEGDLDDSAKILIKQAEFLLHKYPQDYTSFDDALADAIRSTFSYGYDIQQSDELRNVETGIEFINESTDSKAMHCNTANSTLALLAAKTSPHITRAFAFGYLNIAPSITKNGYTETYLTTNGLHAFTVDADGNILDATPSSDVSDNEAPKTAKSYDDLSKEWRELEPTNLRQEDSLNDSLKILAAELAPLLALTGTFYGTMQLSRFLRRHLTPEKRKELSEQMLTTYVRPESIQLAARFLPHICRSHRPFMPDDRIIEIRGNDPLSWIRENVRYDVLEKYLDNPAEFETDSLTARERKSMRHIASFLMSQGSWIPVENVLSSNEAAASKAEQNFTPLNSVNEDLFKPKP